MKLVAIQTERKSKLYTEEESEENDGDEDIFKENEVAQGEFLPKSKIIILNLTWYGLNLMFLVLSVEVVPAQIASLVGPKNKGRCLGGMVAAGAVVMFVTSPLIGMLSDRLTLKKGKRRPIMMAGTIFLSLGLMGMAFSAPEVVIMKNHPVDDVNSTVTCERDLVAKRCLPFTNSSKIFDHRNTQKGMPDSLIFPQKDTKDTQLSVVVEVNYKGNLGLYIVLYLLVTFSFVTITVPYNALVGDKSHPTQRGFTSGVMAAMILFGNVSGAAVGISFEFVGVCIMYAGLVGILVICIIVTTSVIKEKPGKEVTGPINCKQIFKAFWEPLKEHNFRWVFLTRFFMQQGISTITGFLEYWLDDMIQLPHCWTAQTAVAIMLLPLLFAAAASSVICGWLSDQIGRRKPLIITAGFMMTAATLGLMMIKGSIAYYFAIFIATAFGIGFGAYQAVDFALVMDVLPEEKNKAKDMAVWHLALVLPQALATPVGGLILDLFEKVNCEIGLGYIILFSVSSFYFLLSGAFVVKIHGVK